jgi:GMP/IMP 5'-nucleotidase
VIEWTQIDTVLLDMDGTLLDLHFDNFFWTEHVPRIYAQHHDLAQIPSIEELQTRLSIDVGTLNWYCVDHWSEQLGLDIEALKHAERHRISLRPYAMEFLEVLRQGEFDVVLVTNSHPKALAIKLDEVGIRPLFDRIVVSHTLAAAKEERAFWVQLQALNPFDPGRTLLIDDTERILHSAEAFGIAHLLTLLQPDSQRCKRLDTHFPGIHHFDEIMPEGLKA